MTGSEQGEGVVSVADDSLDQLIQQASVPSLASLFRKAKDAGVIGPQSNYGEGQGPPPQAPPPF